MAKSRPRRSAVTFLALGIAYARQEQRYGGLTKSVARELDRLLARALGDGAAGGPQTLPAQLPRPGTILVRQWQGMTYQVTVTDDGFLWNGTSHRSLSRIARAITGTTWNGPRFFGLRDLKPKTSEGRDGTERT